MWSIIRFLSWQYRWENVLVQIKFYPRQTDTITILLQADINVLMLRKNDSFFDADMIAVEYIQNLKYGNSLYRYSVWLCLVYFADIVCPTQLIMSQWKCWMAFVFHAHVEIYNSEEKIGNVKLCLLRQIWRPVKKRFRLSAGYVLISASVWNDVSKHRPLKY